MPLLWDTLSNSRETSLLCYCHVSCHILKRDVKHFCIVPDVPVTKTLCVNLSPTTGSSDLFTSFKSNWKGCQVKTTKQAIFSPTAVLYISENGWRCFCPREDSMLVCTSQFQTTKTPAFSNLTTSFKGSVCPNCERNGASGPLSLSFVTVIKKDYIWTFNLAFGIVHVTAAKHLCVK